MYLKKSSNKKTGKTYLSIARSYRDKERGHSRTIIVQRLGYLHDLEKEYADPIAHFSKIVQEMSEEQNKENAAITITFDKNEKLRIGTNDRKNLGYAALVKVYHELELDRFFLNRQQHKQFEYDTNGIMLLLVISRLLNPCSKKKTFEEKSRYFERFNFTLKDTYRALTHFAKLSAEVQRHIHKQITQKYGRNTDLVYYDVTNYYFEIDKADELRKKGVSKEHRPNPIVQMGLAMDTNGLPIAYRLFSGNESEQLSLRPMLSELKKEYDMGRIIVVADRGLNSGDNIYYTKSCKDGYVLSYSILGADQKFKDYVLNAEEYRNNDGESATLDDNFKIKSRRYVRDIAVTKATGGKMKKSIDEKQIVFYSKEYDKKAKADRAAVIEKAKDLIQNPSKYQRATSNGAAKYVQNLEFDKKTGEILTSGHTLMFDTTKLEEEEKYDGYYAIVTSEMEESNEKIIEMYRGLWKIEESFKVTKSDLEARPVYVSREDHINAHFLTCFIALVISRILQAKTNNKYSVENLMKSLNKISCSKEYENIYLFDYREEESDVIGTAIGVDFTKKRLQLSEIKKILADCKKV